MSIRAHLEAVIRLSPCQFLPLSMIRSVRFLLTAIWFMHWQWMVRQIICMEVNSLQVAPQLSTVESIHICITSEIILHPCLLALFPYSRSWESFRMLSLHYIVIHFVLVFNGLCCCIVVFIHGTGFCFPCIHSFSSNDGCLSGTFVCRSVIAGSTSRPS
ncbi:uncharacterized protein EURHEDRAFT_43562 [Aspergillus ruber CBS 135680]|uniref:Uncharacterized protein n=1 Tax=Aspergillus ruber (strain CBS 135680) TaxID=1388766 RepID=A0A017SGB6_ASPRC|nr:uncharacterized protein EURHEDRAFT_43562 [Aspergillus ruber CBS 135680]EYE95992.1 hypothetical protein EURHEDRAFT_43562 [Aspergillus ruber CBS 135680]